MSRLPLLDHVYEPYLRTISTNHVGGPCRRTMSMNNYGQRLSRRPSGVKVDHAAEANRGAAVDARREEHELGAPLGPERPALGVPTRPPQHQVGPALDDDKAVVAVGML